MEKAKTITARAELSGELAEWAEARKKKTGIGYADMVRNALVAQMEREERREMINGAGAGVAGFEALGKAAAS